MNEYDSKARFFDEQAPQWQRGEFDDDSLDVARWIVRRAGVAPGMRIVEPGCGAGRMSALLSEAVGPTGCVIAADLSGGMIAAARHNVTAANVDFRHCAAEVLQLPEKSVDIVFCFDVFPHFENPGRALDLFRGWLTDDGILIIAHQPGRHVVNAIHKGAGRAIGADCLPDATAMRQLLSNHAFNVEYLTDRPERYFLKATPLRP